MKAKEILVSAVILLTMAGFVQAQEAQFSQAQEAQLSGTIDVTYLTSRIWRGFDYFADDHSAIQPSIDIDLYGTGFGVNVLYSRAVTGGLENSQTMALTLSYTNSLFEGETYLTDYKTGWVYYGYPDEPRSGRATSQAADMQEWFAALSWPDICPAGFVPSYTVLAMWPSEGKSTVRNNAGWAHVIGLGYDLRVPGFLPDTPEQILHLSAEVTYNDGFAPGVVPGPGAAGSKIDHDWSHAVFGVATDFDLGNDLTLTPALYHQASMDDTVNTEDETWFSLSMKYAF